MCHILMVKLLMGKHLLDSWDTGIKRKLDEIVADGAVKLSQCEIKRSRLGQNMELLVNNST